MFDNDPTPDKIQAVAPVRRQHRVTKADRQTEADTCVSCRNLTKKRENARIHVAGQDQGARSSYLSFRSRGKLWSASCSGQFINAQGELGSVGQKIANLVNSTQPQYQAKRGLPAQSYKDLFIKNKKSLAEVCPKYSTFTSDALRTKAWVWFWMVLANEESSCTVKKLHRTHLPNGKRLNPKAGYGLFAAEMRPSDRNWRGKACRGDIGTSSVQVSCAVHTMAGTQLRKGRGALWSGSYWGPVRRYNRQIIPNMRGFKACF